VTPMMYPVLEARVAELLETFKPGTISSRFALFYAACKQTVKADRLQAVPVFLTISVVDNVRQETIAPDEHERILAQLDDPVDQDIALFLRLRLAAGRAAAAHMADAPPRARPARVAADLEDGAREAVRVPRAAGDRTAGPPPVTGPPRRAVPLPSQRAPDRVLDAVDALGRRHHRRGAAEKHMQDYRRSAYERLLGAGVDEETAMIWVGHESRRTMSRYNVRTLRRVQAALERVIAFENPRNTRAGETGGGTGSPS
jgi:hypothetical protein